MSGDAELQQISRFVVTKSVKYTAALLHLSITLSSLGIVTYTTGHCQGLTRDYGRWYIMQITLLFPSVDHHFAHTGKIYATQSSVLWRLWPYRVIPVRHFDLWLKNNCRFYKKKSQKKIFTFILGYSVL